MKKHWQLVLLLLVVCTADSCKKTDQPKAAYREITFLMTGDSEFNGPEDSKRNMTTIQEMNRIQGQPHAFTSLGNVDNILGLLMAGDITLNATTGNSFSTPEFVQFETQYGLHGYDGELNYPVYEGFGNHDYWTNDASEMQNWPLYGDHPVPDAIKSRHGSLHYSWDWGMFHIVNLNLYPGNTEQAYQSLDFLKQDLKNKVGNSKRPIILYHHYGFDYFGVEWWTDEEREAYWQVLKDYNVTCILSGHNHWTTMDTWHNIPVYTAPAACGRRAGYPGFLVVSIKNDSLYVEERWCPTYPEDQTYVWGQTDVHKVYLP